MVIWHGANDPFGGELLATIGPDNSGFLIARLLDTLHCLVGQHAGFADLLHQFGADFVEATLSVTIRYHSHSVISLKNWNRLYRMTVAIPDIL